MKPGGLTCQDMTETANDYVDANLSWSDWVRFRIHLMVCKDCRNYLRQMEATVATLTTMPGEPLPEEVSDELMKRYRKWKGEQEAD